MAEYQYLFKTQEKFEAFTNNQAAKKYADKIIEFTERTQDVAFSKDVVNVSHEINILKPEHAMEIADFLQFIKQNHPSYRDRLSLLQSYL